MGQEAPDDFLELVLPPRVRGPHDESLRKRLDLGCIPVAVVELAQRPPLESFLMIVCCRKLRETPV